MMPKTAMSITWGSFTKQETMFKETPGAKEQMSD